MEDQRKEEVAQFKLRLPRADYEALRVVAFATDMSINELVHRAIRSYLADQGRREQVTQLVREAISQYQVALDKLADA